jgi:chemotaxis methyl-accepting protein methylase/predicted transcriptional regulator
MVDDDDGRASQIAQPLVPVCAIGASAGGVAALQTLFRALSTNLGLAYVVVVHLDPDQPSLLSGILENCTAMPVEVATDSHGLVRDHVYVIPPDRELTIEGDSLVVRISSEPRGHRAPINLFFESVAAARGDGIGVILSGAGSDGSDGIRAINLGGGIVMAQDPAEAEYDMMPRSAIETGIIDIVAPLAGLARQIGEVARSKEAVRSLDIGREQNDLRRIVRLLRTRTGHDFSGYKRATVLRRVVRRMQLCRADTLDAYEAILRDSPDEARGLFNDLLISVTSFFRDPATFESLRTRIIEPLLDEGGEAGLRIWVAGCATGEEAYSIVISFMEQAAQKSLLTPLQVFATDLDESALAVAREGRYPRSIEVNVSEARLRRFFVDEGTHYRIRKEVRDAVLFAPHSLLKDPPFTQLDLISCRNVLIYLDRALQQQIVSMFHYALKPHSHLLLGPAETPDGATDLFAPSDREARIYRARPLPTRPLPVLPQYVVSDQSMASVRSARITRSTLQASSVALHAAALEAAAPPSALVDERYDLMHLSPTAGRFVLHSAGPPSINLSMIVRPELRLDLRAALAKAFDAGVTTITPGAVVRLDGETRRVAMHVKPAPSDGARATHVLVSFLEGALESHAPSDAETRTEEVRRLYLELKAAQDAVALSQSERDLSIEDLRAANEELQSLNEEYRSTAEELDTSKEELQSINEELQTVNNELKTKLDAVSVAHGDLQNLTAATEVGTMFLDANLRLRMLTSPASDLFNVDDSDIGRPITNFTHKLNYVGFERDLREILRTLVPIEAEVSSTDGRWFLMRGRPYRSLADRVEGVVLTFVDVSDKVEAAQALSRSEARQRVLVEQLPQLVWRAGPGGLVTWVSPQWISYTGLSEEASFGRGWLAAVHPEDRGATVAWWDGIRNGALSEIAHRLIAQKSGLSRLFRTRAAAVPLEYSDPEWLGISTDAADIDQERK